MLKLIFSGKSLFWKVFLNFDVVGDCLAFLWRWFNRVSIVKFFSVTYFIFHRTYATKNNLIKLFTHSKDFFMPMFVAEFSTTQHFLQTFLLFPRKFRFVFKNYIYVHIQETSGLEGFAFPFIKDFSTWKQKKTFFSLSTFNFVFCFFNSKIQRKKQGKETLNYENFPEKILF